MKVLYKQGLVALLLSVLWTVGCKNPAGQQQEVLPGLSFYHWTQKWEADSLESLFLQKLKSPTLYLRYFDVDWSVKDQMPVPLSVVNLKEPFLETTQIVPTIFITNRTFKKIKTAEEIEELVFRCGKKIERIGQKLKKASIKEIQFDCDWSSSTQFNYFSFLENFKSHYPQYSISATIRLHQYKYPKRTGIPPIDKGVLMVYNIGELEEWETDNSILDPTILKTYLNPSSSYPIPLDIALPLFSWTVLYRDGQMKKLIVNYNKAALSDKNSFYQKSKSRYRSLKNQYFGGHYLYKGDQLRVEEITTALLKEVAYQLKENQLQPATSLIFYHLDEQVLKNYTVAELKEIHRIFN